MPRDAELKTGIKIARLVSLEGTAKGMSFYLFGKATFHIGRSPKADVYLSDQRVQEEHAKIERDEDSYVITDLSGGETYVNGEAVDIYVLQEGDHLRVGFDILAFNFREVTEENIHNIQRDIDRVLNRERKDQTNVPHLKVLEGISKGYIFPLEGKRVFTIGRSSDNDIKVVDSKISRNHCKIEVEEGQHILFDQNSTNGIYVNGEKKDIHPMEPGDHIRVGFTVFEFRTPEKTSSSSGISAPTDNTGTQFFDE